MTILLSEIWEMENPEDYKVHFARWNGANYPLDVFVRDKREWQGWQEYWPGRNEFSRPLIFSLAQFHHENNTWLFGGIWKVIERYEDRYEVELSEEGSNLIGRLKIRYAHQNRSTRPNFEKHFDKFVVNEILAEEYSGRSFPGYEDILLSFAELEALVRNNRPDWRAALENAKGVYLITDTKTGKRYVGSAYGGSGIWSRWCSYVESGHGGNAELRELVSDPTLEYCRANFKFALLEHRTSRTPDETILSREVFWKNVLQSRGDEGLNRN